MQIQDFELADALGSSLEQTCRNKKMDVTMAASRHVDDRILFHWRVGFGGSPILVTGGCMFAQDRRPTTNLDITTVMRWTDQELQKGFKRISAALLSEGILVRRINLRQLALKEADLLVRVDIEAMCGTIRSNTHVDIKSASGPFAFPRNPERRQLPSLLPKQHQGAVVHVQSLAAAAAEKWIAVLAERHDDFRAKHALDLLSFREMGVGIDAVAVELLRVARHRRIPLTYFAPKPKALEWVSFLLRGDSWMQTAHLRKIEDFDLVQSHRMLGAYWLQTHSALTRMIIAQVRLDNQSKPSLVDRLAARQSAPANRSPQPTP